ncbi:uncharacterized protein LOC111685997 [Lucilia cuprina]|uniref:uncharacterized protein LOC111685997 n=1 Tax=Lucilia cuprina TaxID=7375 RepID=UPI001F05F6B8|nr:uncharacterized protein LOC111685997 [Lucilia cuprina]
MPKSLRREIARKKREYLKRVMKSTESQNDINESENLSTIDDGIDQSSKLTVENNIPPKQDLNTQLKNVFLNRHVTIQLGDDILKVLCENGIDVPSTSKKLLKKKQTPFIVRTVNPGNYYHFGLKKQLEKLDQTSIDVDAIELDIGIDGLPLYKSSSIQLWPILGRILNSAAI